MPTMGQVESFFRFVCPDFFRLAVWAGLFVRLRARPLLLRVVVRFLLFPLEAMGVFYVNSVSISHKLLFCVDVI